jgi:uncharacterized protein (DUF488 family)
MFTTLVEWGPESLLAVVVFLLLMGWLVPKKISDREVRRLEEYYLARIAEIEEHHREVLRTLREAQDLFQEALSRSIKNNQRLVDLNNEYAELARVSTPALVARQEVLEGQHDAADS